MDIDRLLSIHQSHSLMKIGAINKQMLIAQYAQCEQISALQREISLNNSISKQILENQLKEIKHKELLRYYKSLAYAMKEAVGCIEAEKSTLFKCFLCELYSELIIGNIREAKSNLEEISDKEYCNGIELAVQAINTTYSLNKNEYDKSDFSRLLKSQSSYQELQNRLVQKRREAFIRRFKIEKELSAIKPKPLKNTDRGCGIMILFTLSILGLLLTLSSIFYDVSVFPIFFILFFCPFFIPLLKLKKKDKKWKDNYGQYINYIELQKKELLEKLNAIKVEEEKEDALLKSSLYIQTKNAISLTYPHWENTLAQIDSYIPKIETSESRNPKQYKDLYEVAKFIVEVQKVSAGMVQRRFCWGYNRTSKCLDKLSELGIIKDNKVLIQNEEELKKYWESVKETI